MTAVSASFAPSLLPIRVADRARAERHDWSQPLVDVEFEPAHSVLWAFLAASAPPHVSFRLLNELSKLTDSIRIGRYGSLRYRVISSRHPRAFSLGGDLRLFLDLIRAGDKQKLLAYGKAAIDEVWANITGCGLTDLTTIALVNHEAQGGGFEAALSCHLLIAERGVHCGFPESLFGLFPGMGGAQLLALRTDPQVAARLLAKPNRYSVEMLHEIGVIDFLVAAGEGPQFVREIIRDRAAANIVTHRRQQLASATYAELLQTVERWVEQALALGEKDRRSMSYLLSAQHQSALRAQH